MSAISSFTCILDTAEETQKIAEKLAGFCKIGDCIVLHGDLGAGKTTFARGFIQSLTGADEEIVSPTFTLVQTYTIAGGGEIWHCDLYRLKSKHELLELGLDEAFSENITLIEWPEIAQDLFPKNVINVTLAIEGQGRRITLSGSKDIMEKLNKL